MQRIYRRTTMPTRDFTKATLLKSRFGMDVLLKICCIFSEHLWRAALNLWTKTFAGLLNFSVAVTSEVVLIFAKLQTLHNFFYLFFLLISSIWIKQVRSYNSQFLKYFSFCEIHHISTEKDFFNDHFLLTIKEIKLIT